MGLNKLKVGKIKIEVRIIEPNKLINMLWKKGINIYKVKKKNISTLILWINYLDYEEVCDMIKSLDGKAKILNGTGLIFHLGNIKRKGSIVVGLFLFLIILFVLSRGIWAIEINTGNNIAPFEVREQLKSIGVKPGIFKSSIDTTEVEKEIEKLNSEILWLRIRIEGSTLKVHIEEKINPPDISKGEYGNLIATDSGEIKDVYTYDGRGIVKVGDIVEKGDVLIEGIDGKEERQYVVEPRGVVIANVFYEKEIKVQLKGSKLDRSGNVGKDIYIDIYGKKIYLKKSLEGFKNYDKVEISGKILNEVLYYERVDKEIDLSEEEAIRVALEELKEELKQELTREAKIIDTKFIKEVDGDGNLTLTVTFVVEKNIVNNNPISY